MREPEADISALLPKLRLLIEADGPISVAEYMTICLADPDHGYYMKQDPFGRGGDFITAPEISQLFGELIGAWLADTWQRLGAPTPVNLVEAGPGRGTLMSEILRVAALNPGFLAALRVHLVEISPALRLRQQQTLGAAGVEVHWHETLADIPDGPLLLVANEFFDALPVRQYAGYRGQWQERRIGLSDDGSLAFTLGARTLECSLQPVVGAIVEVSPVSSAIMNNLADRIGSHGGAALIIDYGHTETAAGETLQLSLIHI